MCEGVSPTISRNPLMSRAGKNPGDGELSATTYNMTPSHRLVLADGPGPAPGRRWRIGWTRRNPGSVGCLAPSSGPSGRSATSRSHLRRRGGTGCEIFKIRTLRKARPNWISTSIAHRLRRAHYHPGAGLTAPGTSRRGAPAGGRPAGHRLWAAQHRFGRLLGCLLPGWRRSGSGASTGCSYDRKLAPVPSTLRTIRPAAAGIRWPWATPGAAISSPSMRLPALLGAVRPERCCVWATIRGCRNCTPRRWMPSARRRLRVLFCPVEFDRPGGGGGEPGSALTAIVPMTRYVARSWPASFGPACGRLAPPVPHPGRRPGRAAAARPGRRRGARWSDGAGCRSETVCLGAPSCPHANRHRSRKRLTLSVEGSPVPSRSVARSASVLVLAPAPRGPCANLPEIAAEGGVARQVVVTGEGETHPDWPDPDLALLYATAGIGSIRLRRKLGLVRLDLAAPGRRRSCRSVAPRRKIWRGAALLLPPDPSPEDVAWRLAALNEPARRRTLGRGRRRRRASDPALGPGAGGGGARPGVAGSRGRAGHWHPRVFPHDGSYAIC